jgi:hypothetical protein
VKNVELIRQRISRVLVPQLRSWISCLPEGGVTADLLRDTPDGVARTARIVGCILAELGHECETAPDAPGTNNMIQVSKAMKKRSGRNGGEAGDGA